MNPIVRIAQQWHVKLTWPATIALLLFIISGISHPIMVWTGPQQASFFPPKASFSGEQVEKMIDALKGQGIDQAALVKLVPTKDDVLLQVTLEVDKPRQYFDLESGQILPDYDQLQAKWLAAYYTGRDFDDIDTVDFKSEFDSQYPSVNRQLPVWQVNFNGSDNLSAYIHTESMTVAAINNDWKRALQWLFQVLHTQKGLSSIPLLQFAVMSILMLVLMVFSVAGIVLVYGLPKRKKIVNKQRRWHRRIALFVYVPLLMLVISGYYHLWFTYVDESSRDQRLAPTLQLAQLKQPSAEFMSAMAMYKNDKLDEVSLISNLSGDIYARLSVPNGQQGQELSRSQRFTGKGQEKAAIYLPVQSAANLNDQTLVEELATFFLGEDATIKGIKPVTFFGPTYDFRNKRLPVWQIDSDQLRIFIDAKTGLMVDQINTPARYERLSFQMMHKWNWLVPMIGRFYRDIVIVVVLGAVGGLMVYGISLKLARMRYNRKLGQ